MTARRFGEGGGRGHHESVGLVVVGEVDLQVEETRAGNVSGLVGAPARFCATAAPFDGMQEHGGLKDPDVGVGQVLGQPLGGYEVLGMGECHGELQPSPANSQLFVSGASIAVSRTVRNRHEALMRTQFPKPVIASEAWQSRRGKGRRYVHEIATSLRSSR